MFLGADTSRLVCAASGVDRAVGFSCKRGFKAAGQWWRVSACCTEKEEAKETPLPAVDHATRTEFGPSKVEHLVEHRGGDGDLDGLGLVAVEAQPIPDDLLPTRDLALDPGPLIVLRVSIIM
jgi:hypothetical protein